MAWVKLDDAYYHHPKIVAAGLAAEVLFLHALAYCNRYETDGFIPEPVGRRLRQEVTDACLEEQARGKREASADEDDAMGPEGSLGEPGRQAIFRLTRAGLWHKVDGGWQVHDYHSYQPSKAELSQRRADTKARVAASRARKKAAAEAGAAAPPSVNGNGVTPPLPKRYKEQPW